MPLSKALRIPLATLVFISLASTGKVDAFGLSAAFAILVAYPPVLDIDRATPSWLRNITLPAGAIATFSFLMPQGPAAGLVAAVWLIFAIPGLLCGFVRFFNAPDKRDVCVWADAVSVTGPVVGAAALIGSRTAGHALGFPEPLAILTTTHFHFVAGVLPAALSALTRRFRATPGSGYETMFLRAGLAGVVFVPPLTGLFFMFREEIQVPGILEAGTTVLLAACVATWAHFAFWKRDALPGTPAKLLLKAAVVALTLATATGAAFSVALATGHAPASFGLMLRTHGIVNALASLTLLWLAIRHAGFSGNPGNLAAPDMKAPVIDIAPEKALFLDAKRFDMGPDTPGRFEALREALIRYRFYPASVMSCAAAFKTENRPARPGDRIGMTLYAPVFPGLPPLAMPATTVIDRVESGTDRAALGYVTTRSHYGRGNWRATLTKENGRILLTVNSRMTPTRPVAVLGLPFYRGLQKRAHRAGAENLKSFGA